MIDVRFEHEVSEGGTLLTSTGHLPKGATATIRTRWRDSELAAANLDTAKGIAEKQIIEKYLPRAEAMEPDTTEFTRILRILKTRRGDLDLLINGGPPTWWYPRLQFKYADANIQIRGGWLRRAYQLVWTRKSRKETT